MDYNKPYVRPEGKAGTNENWTVPKSEGGAMTSGVDAGIVLCPGCKLSVCWGGAPACPGCESGLPRSLSSKFLVQLQDELKSRDARVAVRWLDGKGRIVHRGAVEREPGCKGMTRRADMCDMLTSYALKHGWAAWGLDAAARELREPGTAVAQGAYTYDWQIEDDAGPIVHWCSCDNQKLESSAQSLSLAPEATIGMLSGPAGVTGDQQELGACVTTSGLHEFVHERSVWAGATPQIVADAMWLAGPGRRQIVAGSRQASREGIKGARGAVETVVLHYLFMNNHLKTLTDGLEMLLLGSYLAALDHGRVRDTDFTPYASDMARHASLGRWVIAADELVQRWPAIMDWHAGCLSTLGLARGLELRAWVFACHWDVVMHYELGSGMDWEEPVGRWMYVAAVLGHDAGDLCSDTRRGCADNCYYAVGAQAGYEGIAACLDIVCDALEAVVLRDTRAAIDVGSVADSACATFERTGGKLCACLTEPCEATAVLARVCGDRRITLDDGAVLSGMQGALRSRCDSLPPSPSSATAVSGRIDHRSREQVYADGLKALALGSQYGTATTQAHDRLQDAYSSAARTMCGELRRRAASFRRCVAATSGKPVLDLSRGCMCGGQCSTWR